MSGATSFVFVTVLASQVLAQNSTTPVGDPVYLEKAEPKDFKKQKPNSPQYKNAPSAKDSSRRKIVPNTYKHPVPRLEEDRQQMLREKQLPASLGQPQ